MVHSSSKFPLSPMCVDTSQKKNIKAWCVFKPSILHTSKMPYKPHTSATSPRRWLNDGNGFFAPKGCNESPKQIHIFCCTLCWKRRNIQSNICKKTKYLQMEQIGKFVSRLAVVTLDANISRHPKRPQKWNPASYNLQGPLCMRQPPARLTTMPQQ